MNSKLHPETRKAPKGVKHLVLVGGLVFAGIVPVLAQYEQFPAGPGKAEFIRICTQCHDVDSVATLRYTKNGWRNLVSSMRDMGAEGTDTEFTLIVEYLAKNFPAAP